MTSESPVLAEQMLGDFSWSFSAYSSAVRCLRLFKYAYIDKIRAEVPEQDSLVFGSAIHSAINAVLTGQDGAAVFEMYWMSYKDKDVTYGRHGWSDLAKMGAEFIRKFQKMHAPKYQLTFAEQRLYGEYKGVKFDGQPDFFGYYDGKRSNRDFKTAGYNYKPEKADTALQLYLYSYLGLVNGHGLPETLGYTVFSKGTGSIQDLTWDFSEQKMYQALDSLVDYCNVIGTQTTYPQNFNACLDFNKKCDHFAICHPKETVNEPSPETV